MSINRKQKEMAFLMGLPASQLSRWEKGIRIPGVYYAIGLAVVTRRLVDDLFSDFRREWQEKIRQRQKLLNTKQNGKTT